MSFCLRIFSLIDALISGGITKVISSFGAAKPADDSSHDPNVISDRQLPKRYCRKPISQEEIDLVEVSLVIFHFPLI